MSRATSISDLFDVDVPRKRALASDCAKKSKNRGKYYTSVVPSGDPRFAEYRPFELESSKPDHQIGVWIRSSERWADGFSLRKVRQIPYIDRLGLITGHSLGTWRCSARQFVATMTSTVAKRLEKYCRQKNSNHVVDKNLGRIIRASYLYMVTGNKYFWDRILHFSRDLEKRGNLIHKYSLKLLCKMDVSTRFVYSQVISQTNWLLFRARRPRDKSKIFISGTELPRKGKCWSKLGYAIHLTATAQAMAGICNFLPRS
jgi:hypothetical protein